MPLRLSKSVGGGVAQGPRCTKSWVRSTSSSKRFRGNWEFWGVAGCWGLGTAGWRQRRPGNDTPTLLRLPWPGRGTEGGEAHRPQCSGNVPLSCGVCTACFASTNGGAAARMANDTILRGFGQWSNQIFREILRNSRTATSVQNKHTRKWKTEKNV